MDADILIPAFIVIVVGGMGSLRGAFIGSLLIGEADTFGKAYLPSMALFFIYLVMAVVLLVRPQGLFGIKHAAVADAPAVTRRPRRRPAQRRAGSRWWSSRRCRAIRFGAGLSARARQPRSSSSPSSP